MQFCFVCLQQQYIGQRRIETFETCDFHDQHIDRLITSTEFLGQVLWELNQTPDV